MTREASPLWFSVLFSLLLVTPLAIAQERLAGQEDAPAIPGVQRAVAPGLPRDDRPAAQPVAVPRADERSVQGADDEAAAMDGGDEEGEDLLKLKFDGAPVEMLLNEYAELTGRTLLFDPGAPVGKTVTLKSTTKLTRSEYLEAVETVLGMNGITLQEKGDKFLRVVPATAARKYPMPMNLDSNVKLGAEDKLITQMIALRHIEIAQATAAIEHLKSPFGLVQAFERMNSVLITDMESNIAMILKLVAYIDQPAIAREELIILPVRFSKASEIKAKLDEIIQQAQTEQQRQEQQRPQTARPTQSGPPGVIRAPSTPTPRRAATAVASEVAENLDQGIIRGEVKIVADDRTGILIFITRPENMDFFERIVQALDVETNPDVEVKVFRLEFAAAADIASMLNDLIGAAQSDSETATAPGAGEAATGGEAPTQRAAQLDEFIQQRRDAARRAAERTVSKIGELSAENIKILSDERTNALLIMARRADIRTLETIIVEMDMMLSQVLIEVVILEVVLSDSIQTGVDWLQRTLIAFNENELGERKAIAAFTGKGGGAFGSDAEAAGLISPGNLPGGIAGLNYYVTHFGLNLDLLIKLTATDSRARILSSPVIHTTDNTEGTALIADQVYFRTGTRVDQFGNPITETELRDVGLELKVTPHINKNRYVMLEIDQSVSNVGDSQLIDGNEFPTTARRSFNASITVRDRETVILGGLVREDQRASGAGIPILKDLPLVGRLFGTDSDSRDRAEVIVMITPYVSDKPQDAEYETARRLESMDKRGILKRGWSDSRLADPTEESRYLHERARELLAEPSPGQPPEADSEMPMGEDLKRMDDDSVVAAVRREPDNAELLKKILEAIEELKTVQEGAERATAEARKAARRAEEAVDSRLRAMNEQTQAVTPASTSPSPASVPPALPGELTRPGVTLATPPPSGSAAAPAGSGSGSGGQDGYPEMQDLDPDVLKMIEQAEKKSSKGIRRIDQRLEERDEE